MENKNVGFLIIGIAAAIVVIIFLFNSALKKIVVSNCTAEHAVTCPMYTTINEQTYLALSIVGVLILIGIIIIFSKPSEKIIVRKIKEREQKKEINIADLRPEEKLVAKMIQDKKVIFQADIIEQTGFGKAKMSRILDKLENRGLIERKRRGMTNVVVLK